jgi:hypothetical protein
MAKARRPLTGKPVLIGEIGYRSQGGGVGWRTPSKFDANGVESVDDQQMLYEAALDVCASNPWLDGMYFWLWETDPDAGMEGSVTRNDCVGHRGTAPLAPRLAASTGGIADVSLCDCASKICCRAAPRRLATTQTPQNRPALQTLTKYYQAAR